MTSALAELVPAAIITSSENKEQIVASGHEEVKTGKFTRTYMFSRPFDPTICPWVSEDAIVKTWDMHFKVRHSPAKYPIVTCKALVFG